MGRIGRIVKKFFCFPMTTVALLLTSCTNILVHDAEEDGVDGMAIDFRTPALTRVAIESFTPGSSFSVWGWYVPEDAANEVFNATTVSTPNGSVWTYEGLRYWKADKTYSFYALYPSVTDLIANAATAAHYNENGDISVTAFDASKGYDLMAASALNISGSNTGKVAFTFGHLLARVEFVVKRNAAADGIEGFNPVIHSAKLYGMHKTADFLVSAADLTDKEAISAGWAISTDESDRTTKNEPFAVLSEEISVNADGTTLIDALLFPQDLTIEYYFEVTYSSASDREPCTSTVPLVSLPLTTWEAGKHYRYTFTVSDEDRILFDTPTVNAWGEATGGIIIVE